MRKHMKFFMETPWDFTTFFMVIPWNISHGIPWTLHGITWSLYDKFHVFFSWNSVGYKTGTAIMHAGLTRKVMIDTLTRLVQRAVRELYEILLFLRWQVRVVVESSARPADQCVVAAADRRRRRWRPQSATATSCRPVSGHHRLRRRRRRRSTVSGRRPTVDKRASRDHLQRGSAHRAATHLHVQDEPAVREANWSDPRQIAAALSHRLETVSPRVPQYVLRGVVKLKLKTGHLYSAFLCELDSKAIRMARVNERSHSFTCHSHVYPWI